MKPFTTVARALLILSVPIFALRGGAEEVVAPTAALRTTEGTASSPASATQERRTIQQYGLTFVLSRSTRNDSTETEEYFLEGESAESWSQMITYQRLTLPEPLGADQYVTWLKKHFEQNPGGPRLKVVQQGKAASIFGVQYAKTEKAPEQVVLALVTVADPRRPNQLHLIQYAINPSRVSLEEMELQVKRWQARFQSQAASVSR